jgi:hypothetical protein
MATACSCDLGLSTTGKPNCQPIQDVLSGIILVPYYNSTGAINEYDLSTTVFNSAFFTARINDVDASKRWFPVQDLDNIEDIRGEAEFETLASGRKYFIKDGVRTFSSVVPSGSPIYKKKLDSAACVKLGAIGIDKQGNLIGNTESKEGFLRPIRIQDGSFYSSFAKTSYTEVQKVGLAYDWGFNENDGDLGMILKAEMSYNVLDLQGLIDIVGEPATSISTTGFTMDMNTEFGTALNPDKVKGLVLVDFTLYNITDSLAVTITSVTESPSGTYTFAFAAQGSAETLRLTVTKNGFDSTKLQTVIITIP